MTETLQTDIFDRHSVAPPNLKDNFGNASRAEGKEWRFFPLGAKKGSPFSRWKRDRRRTRTLRKDLSYFHCRRFIIHFISPLSFSDGLLWSAGGSCNFWRDMAQEAARSVWSWNVMKWQTLKYAMIWHFHTTQFYRAEWMLSMWIKIKQMSFFCMSSLVLNQSPHFCSQTALLEGVVRWRH